MIIKWKELTSEQRDRLVAEKIMGWTPDSRCNISRDDVEVIWGGDLCQCKRCGHRNWDDRIQNHSTAILPYTTSMDAAWKVVEKMLERTGYQSRLSFEGRERFEWYGPTFKAEDNYISQPQHGPGCITRHFYYNKDHHARLGVTCWYVRMAYQGRYWWFIADTPQEAICLAALRAVDVEIEGEDEVV